ncbi:GNAT family N-acetyltransferase [Sutcliffiella rhizosphaerae]|uniref:N-acetyltransferase domain-containing protein n=1 Tax=Sutcliffiella rhizosphaerae TaxID=2880967 RepID=A0ABN8AH33_9BACI|nr:GNAT family N-acetyltransferase [Sutcliffiella rhizosphaerae]CAG9622388.1 hypothetical protein BACCIP111883_03179 [Sutcliffiella rhizosphaerae]
MSVKQLSIHDHMDVCHLFGNEMDNYQFILNDLLANHYKSKQLRVLGNYENNKLTSILLNHAGNLTYYENSNQSIEPYLPFLQELNFYKISGPSEMVGKLLPFMNIKHDSFSHMGAVHSVKIARRYPHLQVKTIQTEDEIGLQYDLFTVTEEFQGSLAESKQAYMESEFLKLSDGTNRSYYLSIDGRMAACAATVKEEKNSAIIIGVFTDPKLRGSGYGTEVLHALCNQLISEGKIPYLFYSNPLARSVYRKLGMTEVCEWRVAFV